jgi:organic radical activating enzyme
MSNDNNSLCVMPWVGMHVDSMGGLHPCCRSLRDKDSLENNNGEKFNLVNDKITDFSISSSVLKLKKDLIEGNKPSICNNCWYDEKIGKKSFRKSCNEMHSTTYNQILTSNTDTISAIQNLDLQVGNRCNQKCRMCDPYSSSGLAKDQQEINNYSKDDIKFFCSGESFSWPQKDIVWDTLKENSSKIEYIKLWGGEAFLEKKTIDFLEYLIENNLNSGIELLINTNGHAIKEDYLNLFNKFRKTNLLVSIDGKGIVNEYIRFPSNWIKTVEEIDRFTKWSKETPNCNVKMSFNSVFQLLNLFNITELIEFLFDKFFELNYKPEIHVNFLSQPYYLSAQVAPAHIKVKAIEMYKNFLDNNAVLKENDALTQNISSYINFINEKDDSESFRKFLEVNGIYDNQRKQNLRHCIPEIFE